MPPKQGRATPLDRTAVLAEAVVLADEGGLAAISMRALAARLGVVPMALYKHVADRADLVGGMIDTVVQTYPTPDDDGWQARVRARALAARDAQEQHPWMRAAIDEAERPTLTTLAYMDAVAADFIDDGFSVDLTHYAMHALGHRIWGYSTEAFRSAPAGADDEAAAAMLAAQFPHVASIAMDTAMRNPAGACDERHEFAFGLDLLLDAFARLREAGWVSAVPDASLSRPASPST
ncbi:TetR/AcrR family transcriptional regulator [Microbacterium sp. ASV49]|uniref:TetR/AcrR family transcriptional regulator C-terminal domain-containing protein n=1 Tax=Microbacterium candidum TaxID=3041922 RepID=A0ABT7MUV6_9MICO|nr:TetR/AcrR family transcriptional regulator C-terminal domain-containing protein [Microbacterium sp. ASV49]MDL9978235.1 TetR/AcrR family transcriptional regulator C-terminal domain-containing protein [Microbacterium sp. ASV49]